MDDFSRRTTVLFMKTKDETLEKIKKYINWMENKFSRNPKVLKVDNGTEYINKEVEKFLTEKGIELQTTAPYSPPQNGTAERVNRMLVELARAMLIGRSLPTFLWEEAVAHAVYLRNRASTRSLKGKTPDEMWTGKRPDVSHFQEFGCDVWILSEGLKDKMKSKAHKYVFTGFEEGPKAVRYYDASSRRIKISRNYTFRNEPSTEIAVIPLSNEGESGGARAVHQTDENDDDAKPKEDEDQTEKEKITNIPPSTAIPAP